MSDLALWVGLANEHVPRQEMSAVMSELYGRYHGRILGLARSSAADGAWRAKLREILAEFDDDCRRLPPLGRCVLRNELSSQIEHEALQFSDPDKRAVLTLALKHFDARRA